MGKICSPKYFSKDKIFVDGKNIFFSPKDKIFVDGKNIF